MTTARLIVYGDIGMDLIMQVARPPHSGEDTLVHAMAWLPAGSAANCAVVAARLGASVDFVGLIGSDHLVQSLLADLRLCQVGIEHLRQVDGPTAVIVVIVDTQGERTFYSYRGVNSTHSYGAVAPGLLHPGDYLHLTGYSFQDEHSCASALALLEQAHLVGARIALDPSFLFARDFGITPHPFLTGIDYIFPNETEAYLMTGAADPLTAARRLQAFGIRTVIVKQGAQGCVIADAQGVVEVPAYPVRQVVDTTGAGDAFCGGFLMACLRGSDPLTAAKLGHAAAASVIEGLGGHQTAPTLGEALTRMAEFGDAAAVAQLQRLQPTLRFL
jgi:sugar/nucleoside kinase (ribokinase family)